jgi:hypothetical protein
VDDRIGSCYMAGTLTSAMRLLVLSFVLMVAACASEVQRTSASLSTPPATAPARIEIVQDTQLQLSAGYARTLPRGSVWELRGGLPEGAVYRRADGVFTVEGAHVHEAYLVIAGNRLVGFYLPVERAYSAYPPLTLSIK